MTRGLFAATAAALLAVAAGCGDTTAGRLCQPGDATACGKGFQCNTFCDAATEPQSICTPSFGAEATGTFHDEGLIDGKVAFGQLSNVSAFDHDLRIEIAGVKGLAMPLLERVGGNLSIVATELECLSMPRLTQVDGVLLIDRNGNLQKTELAQVQTTQGAVITDNGKLSSLQLTSVTSFTGDVIVSQNGIADLNLERLTNVAGSLTITNNKLAARHLALDALANVSGCVDVAFDVETCTDPSQLGAAVSCCTAAGRPTLASTVSTLGCTPTCP